MDYENMTDEELAELQRVTNGEIEALQHTLARTENELYYRKHPECRKKSPQATYCVRLYFQSYKLREDWGSYLLHCYNSWKDAPNLKNTKWMTAIKRFIKKNKGTNIADILDENFRYNVKLDYDFASKLSRLDVINVGAFTSTTELGRFFLEFVEQCEVDFILAEKGWIHDGGATYGTDLDLRFLVCQCAEDYFDDKNLA